MDCWSHPNRLDLPIYSSALGMYTVSRSNNKFISPLRSPVNDPVTETPVWNLKSSAYFTRLKVDMAPIYPAGQLDL